MATRTLSICSGVCLECTKFTPASLIIGVSSSITTSGQPYIDATLTGVQSTSCSSVNTITFSYDDTQLTTPPLTAAQVISIECRTTIWDVASDAFPMANNVYATWRNAAGSADISVLKVDGSDNTWLNADTGNIIKLAVAGTSEVELSTTALYPAVAGGSALGTTSLQWLSLYIGTSGSATGLMSSDSGGTILGSYSNHGVDLISNNLVGWSMNTSYQLVQNSTRGGSIIMPRVTTTIITGVSSIDSDVIGITGSAPGIYQARGSVSNASHMAQVAVGADAWGVFYDVFKTRNTAANANTIVTSGDQVSYFRFWGADGVSYQQCAGIKVIIDGTPGSGDMPGGIVFQTTPDGSATVADAIKIGNDGRLQNMKASNESTGAGTATIGASNFPGTTAAAVNTWLSIKLQSGTVGYIPVWI